MNNFSTIEEIINEYKNKPLEEKLNVLRKLSKDVTYNEDYQIKIATSTFLYSILTDISNLIKNDSDYTNNASLLTYTRLFFMFLHNELGNESKYQLSIYKTIFTEKFDCFQYVFTAYKKDLKVQKFLLGIVYKLFFLNTNVLTTELAEKQYNFFIELIKNLNYDIDIKTLQSNKDLQEINDWIHIIFEYIFKNEEICEGLNKEPFFFHLMGTIKSDKLLLLIEIIRDIIDYAKDSKILLVSTKYIELMVDHFLVSLTTISNIINENDLKEKYSELSKSNEELISNNKMLICYIDIFSVLLTTEDLNNVQYRKAIFNKLSNESFYLLVINMIYNTDNLYDIVFLRNKALKKEEQISVPVLEQNNLFFGFQTNIMKFLSNFCYKNEPMKQFFISNPKHFYSLLNHLKIDKCNPLKKEWTVLMIKSLCENCYQIQKLIMDLKPVEMDPLLKDYIINKGKQNIRMGDKEKEIYFSTLNKK